MQIDFLFYLPEILSVTVIAIFMSISPGADFVMVTKNSLFHDRIAGLYSAMGISLAIWIHVAYSIAGLAVIISNSVVLFSFIKYLGAAYLIYIGWKSFQANTDIDLISNGDSTPLSHFKAFKMGVLTNALNPKTTLFFLSIFTQVVNPNTPLFLQLLYGAIISLAHLLWFSIVAVFITQPSLLKLFNRYKNRIEKGVGAILIAFGLKIALTSNE